MYSFGSCKKQVNFTDSRPGPGEYDQGLVGSHYQKSPQWKIGSEAREKQQKSFVPGPGTYQPNDPQGIKYSFGRKTPIKDKEIKPGPGAYETQFKEFAPAYSMSGKTKESNSQMANPGPGTYQQKSTVIGVPSSKIGTEKRGDWPNNYTPGPGSYYNSKSYIEGPKYGFGSQMQRPNTANPTAGGQQSLHGSMVGPGPGTYNSSSMFNSKNKGPAMSSRHNDTTLKQMYCNPGPGAYDPSRPTGKSSIRIGTEERARIKLTGTPGPGTYTTNFATKPRTPGYGMGTQERMRPMSAQSKGPGPGNYQYQSKIVEGPKWGFGARKEDSFVTGSRKGQPGPGQYLPNYSQVNEKQATYKFGTSSRGTQLKKQHPGPGQYDIRKGLGGPKYGFGSTVRQEKLNMSTPGPGPGAYTIEGLMGKVPKYLLPGGPRHV